MRAIGLWPEGSREWTVAISISSRGASAKGDRCSLILVPDAKDGTVHLRRIEFHRLLSALVRTVQGAGWDPRDLPDWLYPPPAR